MHDHDVETDKILQIYIMLLVLNIKFIICRPGTHFSLASLIFPTSLTISPKHGNRRFPGNAAHFRSQILDPGQTWYTSTSTSVILQVMCYTWLLNGYNSLDFFSLPNGSLYDH